MIFPVLFLVFMLVFTPAAGAVSIPSGEAAPGFTLGTVEGNTVSLAEYREKVVVLIYWRTGQQRSLLSLKDGNDIFKEFQKKNVNVLGVIAGNDDKDKAEKAVRDNGIEYPLLIDYDRQLYSDYGIRVYPTTVIIDKEGKLAYAIPTHSLTHKRVLRGHIRNILGEIDEQELKEELSTHKEEKDKSVLEALRLYNLALKFTQTGMIELAASTAMKSVEAKPDMAESHILLGFLYLEQEDAEKALEAFNRALELDPHSKDAKTGLGGALVLKGDTDRAIEILDDAAATNPYPQMAYYELGKAYEKKGEKEKSIDMYKKAVEKIIEKNILPSAISKCQ